MKTSSGSKNEVIIVGTATKDAEYREFEAGAKQAKLKLVTNEWIQAKGKPGHQEAEYHDITLWGREAEVAKGIEKGAKVTITGRIKTRSWDDKATGAKRYRTEIQGNFVSFVNKDKGEPEPASEQYTAETVPF